MNGLPYYKAYPRDFIEGTIGMPFELKGAYRLVLDLIYMQGGRLPDDARYISGQLGCSVRMWKSLRERLIGIGKISVSGEFLTNERADKELESLAKLQETKRENRAGSNKSKDLEERPSDDTEPESDIPPLPPKGDDDEPDRFDEFWSVYPHRNGQKKGKKPARLKWNAARKRGVSQQTMIDGARASHSMPDVKRGFPRDPVTWINQEGWDDDPGTARDSPGAPAFHFERFDRKSA